MPLHTPPPSLLRSLNHLDSCADDNEPASFPIVAWLESLPPSLPLPSPPLSPKRKRTLSTMAGGQSNAKRRRTGDQNEAEDDQEESLDTTPRAGRSRSNKSTKSTTTSTDTAESISVGSGRSVKQLGDTFFAAEPIVAKDYDPDDIPASLSAMFKQIKRFSRGIGVLPARLMASSPLLQDDDDGYLAFDTDNSRDRFGPVPSQYTINRIVHRTKATRDHCEAEWNCHLHTAILTAAFENTTFDNAIDFHNCSAARIEKRLLPAYGSQKSCQVDFAVVLQTDAQELDVMRALAAGNIDFSINQTLYTPFKRAPVAISLETKVTGEKWRPAELQVGIWVAAQFKRLQELLEAGEKDGDAVEPLPALPLLVIQGRNWHFLMAERRRGQGEQTTIWGPIQFGDSCSKLGVYQIIATLQYLGKWATTEYREWFDRKVLRVPAATAAGSATGTGIDTEPRTSGGLEANGVATDTRPGAQANAEQEADSDTIGHRDEDELHPA
ncbi:uncharacterized protein K452DRAFT_303628 [Aplosporella prunicola CBS 121167]|uniref:PD-(D/E)XK nuclease-like domain-containing protein n=1 Tax=Aplosporella prunicola CBS 121167 TaxID=1176127 RepID=A0A6A6AUE4_9PEZI|nr:uncharacterized protein K452DRAFT_303628 [Aplosporella prunicola CBS 121167]KAF2135320.1 hypothetical protein K452DRAFT_303628 [Aplosporella prunicola CBS 121167]